MANTTAIKRKIDDKFDELILAAGPTGNVYYVDSVNGDDNNAGTDKDKALASLAAALALTSDDDTIVCLPYHVETTSAIAVADEVRIIGIGVGRARPAFTASTAATDLFNITDANVLMQNLRLIGAASGVTAILDLAATAPDFVMDGCVIETGAAPVDIITISADRHTFKNCTFVGTAAGPDNVFMYETKTYNGHIHDCIFNYLEFDIDENIVDSPADAQVGLIIERCQMLGLAVAALTIKSSIANKFNYMNDCTLIAHAAVTIAELVGTTIEGFFFGQNYGADTTKSERAVVFPATTAA